MGVGRHVPPHAGGRVLRAGGHRSRHRVADPFFGGAGPRRTDCTGLRRVHDRLPAQREEHDAQELPRPRGAGRRPGVRRSPPYLGVKPRQRRRLRGARRATGKRGSADTAYASPPTRWCSPRARTTRRSCCTACATRATCRTSPPAGRADPHQLRVDPRRHRDATAERRLHARASRSRRRSTPTSAPTSSRSATARAATSMVAAADGADRRRGRRDPRWQTWLKEMLATRCTTSAVGCGRTGRSATIVLLVMQTLDNSITVVTKRRRLGWSQVTTAPGPRRAEPDLDPGGQRRSPPDRREDRRRPRRHARRARQHADDRALHRRLRASATHREHGVIDRYQRVLRSRRAARRRRLGGLGQPRREPVADDHRAGRARDGVLAQQGRGATRVPRSAMPTCGSSPWRRTTRWCPRARRPRCGSRSSTCARGRARTRTRKPQPTD